MLTFTDEYNERDVELGLVKHIEKFLLKCYANLYIKVRTNLAECRCGSERGTGTVSDCPREADYYDKQVASLQTAAKSTSLLMKHGNTTYLEVLTAQQTLLNAQLSQVANRFTEIQGVITLYQLWVATVCREVCLKWMASVTLTSIWYLII